jgi:hypothetical protein
MPKLKRTSPCNKCPFRRTSLRGWLGSDTPASFLATTLATDGEMPCHTAVNYEDPQWRDTLPDAPLCAGGLQHIANQFRRSRDPQREDDISRCGRNPEVFQWPHEFLTHHMRRDVTADEARQLIADETHAKIEQGDLFNEPAESIVSTYREAARSQRILPANANSDDANSDDATRATRDQREQTMNDALDKLRAISVELAEAVAGEHATLQRLRQARRARLVDPRAYNSIPDLRAELAELREAINGQLASLR